MASGAGATQHGGDVPSAPGPAGRRVARLRAVASRRCRPISISPRPTGHRPGAWSCVDQIDEHRRQRASSNLQRHQRMWAGQHEWLVDDHCGVEPPRASADDIATMPSRAGRLRSRQAATFMAHNPTDPSPGDGRQPMGLGGRQRIKNDWRPHSWPGPTIDQPGHRRKHDKRRHIQVASQLVQVPRRVHADRNTHIHPIRCQ